MIKILNKHKFNQLMVDKNFDDSNIEYQKDFWIISINNTDTTSYFKNNHYNVLVLNFDDTEEDKTFPNLLKADEHFKIYAMNESQGKEVINFLNRVKQTWNSNSVLLIHCHAGQNRSGSVGDFACDYLEYNRNDFKLDNPGIKGNSTVSRILNRLWRYSHYD